MHSTKKGRWNQGVGGITPLPYFGRIRSKTCSIKRHCTLLISPFRFLDLPTALKRIRGKRSSLGASTLNLFWQFLRPGRRSCCGRFRKPWKKWGFFPVWAAGLFSRHRIIPDILLKKQHFYCTFVKSIVKLFALYENGWKGNASGSFKGQLISKCLFVVFNFSKKQTKQFDYYHSS